ncbi:hypothetical protein COHA_010164 [Chlorella ohadii]|uniref:Uncharacterized protein n=1 Tax=Chlorella ohadii TaxID=2649997 RepID=A0AAD5DIA0_9CHLO|nr:hypothetical protein COHA_010164 [Chlorella ohadii]
MPKQATAQGLLLAARGGNAEAVKRELAAGDPEELKGLKDASGASPLHLAALGAHEDAVEALLECGAAEGWLLARDLDGGATPLHCAVKSGVPMVAYQLAAKLPAACLEQDGKQQTPIQLASAADKGEVLNAMLLACAGHSTPAALSATRALLAAGAVCDTWAPNGSSALMLAASVDCAECVGLLLDHSASLELQDALGRTALMFAAGNNARAALEGLLDRGASVSIRDRRGRNVMDYAAEGSDVRQVLQARIAEMESRAARLQEELLAELLEGEASAAPAKEQRAGKKGKKKKGKATAKGKAGAEAAQPEPEAAQPPAAELAVVECCERADAAKQLQLQQEQPSGTQPAAATPAASAPEREQAQLDGDSERPGSPDWQDTVALAAELAALRAQLAQAQRQRQQAEELHQLELAAVVSEAAAHEASAVLEAVTAERTRCIFRFAAFLQNSNLAPELLASYGVTGTAAGFASAGGISGLALPHFPRPQANPLRPGKAAPVAVPAAPAPLLRGGDLSAAASLSPLSTSPTFCYTELEQRLREEFSGDVSCFLQPAAAELG